MNKHGTALAEWITAVAICSLLTAVVAPVLGIGSSKSASEHTAITCISNVDALGLAGMQYAQDFDEHMPSGANWYGTGSGWAEQIEPYVRDGSEYHCPDDKQPGDLISYGYNSNMVRLTGPVPSPPIGIGLRNINAPAYTVILFEVAGNQGWYDFGQGADPYPGLAAKGLIPRDDHATGNFWARTDGYSPAGDGLDPPSGAGRMVYATGRMLDSYAYDTVPAAHSGKSAVLFADGHVEMVGPNSISAGKDNIDAGSCGGDRIAASAACAERDQLATFSAI